MPSAIAEALTSDQPSGLVKQSPVSLATVLKDRPTLLDAWWRVRRGGGAAGPDGVSVEVFAGRVDAHIDALLARLAKGTYRPGPLKRVFLPKPDGGARTIGIANVEDRLLQTAAGQWLQNRFEPFFLPASFAFRPAKGPQRAAIAAAQFAADHGWVVNTDIEKFFDNVDHSVLSRLLSPAGVETADQALLLRWLCSAPLEHGRRFVTVKGVPQGLPISPPLANLYLHGFDAMLADAGRSHVRFADDFLVFAQSESDATDALRTLGTYLKDELRLSLKLAKTSVVRTERGADFVGFTVTANGLRLPGAAADRFRVTCEAHLSQMAQDLPGAIRQANDLVRGWRAYYGRLSPAIDESLALLDSWRRDRVMKALTASGHSATMADALFESLTDIASTVTLSGYAVASEESVEPRLPEPAPAASPPRRSVDVKARATGLANPPWLTDRGDLIIPTHGAFVTRSGQTIVIKWRKQTLVEIPLEMIKHISIVGQGTVLATTAVAACVSRGIRIWLTDRSGRPIGHFTTVRRLVDQRLARSQIRVALGRSGTHLVSKLLAGKIRNQRALLLYHAKASTRSEPVRIRLRGAAATLRASVADIRLQDGPLPSARQELLLLEARAAAAYWSAFASLLPPAFEFPGRRGRGADDPVNSLLNYGYYKLLQWVWAAVDRVGLVPWLGFLHTGRRGSPALVLDLMEEFRAVAVDRVVLGLIGRGFLPRQRPDGRLRSSSRLVLERALSVNLDRPVARSGAPLATAIRDQVGKFRRSLQRGQDYQPLVLGW